MHSQGMGSCNWDIDFPMSQMKVLSKAFRYRISKGPSKTEQKAFATCNLQFNQNQDNRKAVGQNSDLIFFQQEKNQP